jgi:ribosomal protein S12 methylthiotransferase accessory factor
MLAPEAYGDPSRPRFTRFDPRVPVDWVWGYSFGRAAPVLVPRDHVYFAPAAADGVPPLVPETSSGCALGGCYEEAAVHALLEVAERDAFLLTWYARMPAPRVALESVRSPAVRLLADRIAHEHGYRVDVFDTSLEHGIPSLALVAVDTAPAPGRPAAMCSAAAHPDPERACWSALTELALFVAHLTARYPAEQDRAAAMVRDPGRVVAMPDHALLHGHPDTLPRWEFLYGGPDGRRSEPRGFAEAFTGRREAYPDLRADLADLTGRYHRAGMEVIVVDQTGPEQRAAGLHAVRAVVPGTLPMTFGHRNRRLHGLPRLRTVPVALGHRTAPLRDDEVNPHPHPFS